MKAEPEDNIDDTIKKLEILKTLVKHEHELSMFDNLIIEAKEAKVYQEATENLENDVVDHEDLNYEEYPDDYWEQEYEVEN